MEGFYIHERENPTSFLIGLEYRDEVYSRSCYRNHSRSTLFLLTSVYIYIRPLDRYRGKARKWIETRRRTRRIRATPFQAITLIAVISIATDSPPILAISRELKYRKVRMAGRREPFFFLCINRDKDESCIVDLREWLLMRCEKNCFVYLSWITRW